MRRHVSAVVAVAFVLALCAVPSTARGEPILINIASGFADFTFGTGGTVSVNSCTEAHSPTPPPILDAIEAGVGSWRSALPPGL